MPTLCRRTLANGSALGGVLAAYVLALALQGANPAGAQPHAQDLAVHATNLAALLALLGVVHASNRGARGCSSNAAWAWGVAAALGLNLAARAWVVRRLGWRNPDNWRAKYSRWDAAAGAAGTLAVLALTYYALVPRARFRTTAFLLALVFVMPPVFAAPRLWGATPPDEAVVRRALDVSAEAYAGYDGADQATRVTSRRFPDATYIAFAGTETAKDVRYDVDATDREVPRAWLGDDAPRARAHAGFLRAYASVRDDVLAAAREAAAREAADRGEAREAADRGEARGDGAPAVIVCCGHSLGGAIATLAALDLAANLPPGGAEVRMVSFGSPSVGDAAFVRAFDARVPRAHRVVNPFDPVPHSLTAQFPHVKGLYAVATFTRDTPLTAHGLAAYRLALRRPRWARVAAMFAPALYLLLGVVAVVAWNHLRGT